MRSRRSWRILPAHRSVFSARDGSPPGSASNHRRPREQESDTCSADARGAAEPAQRQVSLFVPWCRARRDTSQATRRARRRGIQGLCDATSAKALRRILLQSRSLRVGRCAQRDVAQRLSGAIEQAQFVLDLAPTREEQGRVLGEGAEGDHHFAIHRVARELPHHARGPRLLGLARDLLRIGSDSPHRLPRRRDNGPHSCRGLREVVGQRGRTGSGRHEAATRRVTEHYVTLSRARGLTRQCVEPRKSCSLTGHRIDDEVSCNSARSGP